MNNIKEEYTKQPEKAVLVGVNQTGSSAETKDHLDELEFLAVTAGAETIKRFIQNLDKPNPKTFVGPGKLQEILEFVQAEKADMVIFDDELSPAQIKNIERAMPEIKILDRNNLILDIFAGRAQTAQARTQVELAQSEYLLPRLTNMWTHLSRQKGGIGMKGPGEKEIETDRRILRNRISLLKEKLKKIEQQNNVQRKNRQEKVRVALVGYTNAGKSTLMNELSNAAVMAENKLFATLDTTVRKIVIDTVPILLSDTVGFIRKLPVSLVESFKSTLEEVKEADILLHVVDITHPALDEHISVVEKTLQELGAAHKRVLLVYNKIDSFVDPDMEIFEDTPINDRLEKLNKYFETPQGLEAIFISAATRFNLDNLRKKVKEMVLEEYRLIYPHSVNEEMYKFQSFLE